MENERPNNNNRRVVVNVPASSPQRQQQQQQHATAALSSAEAATSAPSPPPLTSVNSSSGSPGSPVVASGRSILRKMAAAAAANDDGNTTTTRGSNATTTTNLLSTVVTVKKAAKRFAAASATKKQQRRRESNSLSDTAQSSSPSQDLFTAMKTTTISVTTNSNADTTRKKTTTTTTGALQQEVSDDDPAGLRSSESFGALNPLASSSSFHQSTRGRRATREGSGAFGALEKEDTFLGSASSGGTGITLRKIFNDADLAGVGFLTPAQAFAAMKVVGVVLKKKEFYEILDEIDVNAGSNEHNSAEESDWLRKEKRRRRRSSSSGNKRRGTFDDDDGSTTESSEDNNFSAVAQPQQKSSRRRVVILEEGAPHDDGELSLSLEDDEVVITQVTNNAGNQRQHQQHDNPLSADSLSISSGLDHSSDEDATTTTTTTTTTASPTIIVNNQNALSAAKASILEKVASRLQRRRRRNRRVLFEDFEKLIELWQSAARFQLFEKRSDETEARLQATMDHRFLATDSAAMWVWQLIMLFVGCYLVMVPVAVFTNTVPEVAQYFALYTPSDAIVTVLLVADMILKCCTCITTHVNGVSVVVDDLRGIMREYVRSPWFWIDLLVLVPWRFTILAGGDTDYIMRYDNSTGLLIHPELSGCHGCKTLDDYNFAVDIATVLLLIRGLKFLEHYRYFEETGLTPLTRNFVQRQYVVGMGIIQGARFVVLVHTLAVIYLSLYRYNNANASDTGSSGSSASSSRSYTGKGSTYDLSNVPSYAEAMYLVLYCMATVGYGDIPPRDNKERAFFMFLTIVGWLFNAYIIGSLVGFFQTSDIETERQSKLLELSTLLEHFEVPPSLTLEILSFEDYLLANSIKKSFGHIVNDLPLDMQRNVELWNRVKVINSIPFFQVFHKSAKLQICNVLVEITFCPEDYVYMIGELGTEMFFVNHGFVDILDHNSDLVVTKKAGDSFGEIGAFAMESISRSEDAKCLTYCEFFVLAKEPLMEVRQRYPRVQRQVEDYCEHGREVEMNKLDLAMSVRYVSGYNTSSTNIAAEGGCGVFIQRRESTGGDGADKWGGGGGGNELAQLKSEILPDGQFGLGLFSEESAPSLSPPRHETATGLSGFAITTATSTSVQCKRPPPIYIGIDVEEFTVGPIIRSNNNKNDDGGGEGDDVVVVGGFVTSGPPQETSAYSIDKHGREEEEGDDSDGGRELQQLDDSTPERRSRGRGGGGDGSGAGADARRNSGASLLLFSSVSPGTNAIPPPPPMAASQQQQLQQQQQQQHSTSPSLPSSSGLVQATVQKTALGSFTSLPGVSVVVAAATIPNAPPLQQQQQQQAATTRRGTTTPPSRDLSVVIPPQTPPRTPLHHSLSVSAMRKQSSSSQLYAVAHQQQQPQQQQLRHSFDATPPSQHLQVPTGRSPSTSQNFQQQQPQQPPAKQQQSRHHHPPKQPRHQQVLVPIALDMLNEDLMIQSQTSGGCDSSHQSLSPFIPPLEQQPTTAADLNFATTNHGGGSHIKSPMHQQRQRSRDFYFSLNQHGSLNNTSATSFLTTASGGGGGGVGGKRQQQQQAPQRPLTPKMLHSPMLAYPRSSPQSDLYQRQVSQPSSGGSVVGGAAAGGGGAATTAVARKFAKSPLTSALIPVGPPPMLLGISATTPTTGAHHRPTRFGEVSTSQLFPLAAVESNNTPLHHGVAATAALGSGGGGGGLYNFGTNNNDATIIDTGGDGTGTTNNNTGEEWNGVRGEVGRLAHSALVELVMQYLCDGMAINELLQQQQQQQKGSEIDQSVSPASSSQVTSPAKKTTGP